MARQPFPGLNNNVSDACEWTAWPNDSWRYSRKNSQKTKKRHIIEAPSIPSRIFEQLKKKVLKIWVTVLCCVYFSLASDSYMWRNPFCFLIYLLFFLPCACLTSIIPEPVYSTIRSPYQVWQRCLCCILRSMNIFVILPEKVLYLPGKSRVSWTPELSRLTGLSVP